uniref:Tetraspanin 37 n=1 Tax=Sinocyclocheilus rhinocerous TaxID=307959 RepID=A0A673MUC2_9TELE
MAQCPLLVIPLVFNSFILHFLQLAGITGLGGSFLLHKYLVYGVFFSSFYIILPALLAVVGGVILFISGCIGCVVSNKKPSCGHGLLDVDLAPLKDVFQNYSGNSQDPDTKKSPGFLCVFCCGVKNYTDWLETPWFNHSGKYKVPLSCCNKNFHSCNGTLNSPQLLYNEGCQIKLEENLLLAVHFIIIISLVVLFLLVSSVV